MSESMDAESEEEYEYTYEEDDDGTGDVVVADPFEADVAACRAVFGDGAVVAITRLRGLLRFVLVIDARELLGEETRRAWGVSGPLTGRGAGRERAAQLGGPAQRRR